MCEFLERFETAADRYLAEMKFTGRSAQTISNYRKRIRYFKAHWTRHQLTGDPQRADIRSWRDALLDRGASPETVRQYLVELNGFFEFCIDDEVYEENPVNRRVYPKAKAEKSYDKILEPEQLALLWENREAGGMWPRNYAIIVLLLDGKIRNAELRDLRLSDIDLKYSELHVRKGKGNKSRTVTLTDISLSAIRLYLASGIRPESCTDDDLLFGVNRKDGWRKGSRAWLSSLVEKHVRNITGEGGIRTHALRHNGAVFDLNNGITMERLQAELGHSSVTTTEIYAGRLGSRRHQEGFKVAIIARDYWASKSRIKLREMQK